MAETNNNLYSLLLDFCLENPNETKQDILAFLVTLARSQEKDELQMVFKVSKDVEDETETWKFKLEKVK